MALSEGVKNFLNRYFVRPLTDESVHYNPFNTAVYAALFGLAAAYLGKPVLQRLDVSIDREFVIAFTPFVFFGGAARVLEDAGIVKNVLLVSPFIYVLMFAYVGTALFASKKLEERGDFPYHVTMSLAGTLSFLAVISALQPSFAAGFIATVVFTYALLAGLVLVGKSFLPEASGMSFFLPVMAHYWDGVTSFAVIWFSSSPFWEVEKHVLGRQFMYALESIGFFPPLGMLLMKTVIVIPAVYYIETGIENDFDRKYYLFLIAVLGFALGTRNFLSFLIR